MNNKTNISEPLVMEGLTWWHPVLKNQHQIKFVILFGSTVQPSGLEGYTTLEDAKGDYAYQMALHGKGVIFKVETR
jgi:hypothetical protein